MKVTRIYADRHGESHFGELNVALSDAGKIGRLSEPIPAAAVIFRTTGSDFVFDWHTAPQRQFIVLLDGQIEIEVSAPSGERRRFGGGDVLLVEDTFGRGHRTRSIEVKERRSIFVVLDDQKASTE